MLRFGYDSPAFPCSLCLEIEVVEPSGGATNVHRESSGLSCSLGTAEQLSKQPPGLFSSCTRQRNRLRRIDRIFNPTSLVQPVHRLPVE